MVHYHQGEEAIARRVVVLAEDVHVRLLPHIKSQPHDRTNIVPSDALDDANGWAPPLPYNLITLDALKNQVQHFSEKMLHGKTCTQLSIEERAMIQTQLSMGHKPGQIARELGRLPATLSRELKRNGWIRPQLPCRIGSRLTPRVCQWCATASH